MKYGYARVSSKDQKLEDQVAQLEKFGCDMIRSEKVSGTTVTDRVELKTLLEFLRKDDVLVVTRVDRLARSIRDLSNIVEDLALRGVSLIVLQQNIDTTTPTGRAFLSMLGVFAEFENDIRRERQMAGIIRAKAAGKYKGGRAPLKEHPRIRELFENQVRPVDIAQRLGISRASVYRSLSMQGLIGAQMNGEVSCASMTN